MSEYVDSVVIVDGAIERAVADQFMQPMRATEVKAVIMLALTEDVPDNISGAGLPIRNGLLVDVYCVVRPDGKSRYTTSRERLYDISDALMYSVFDCPNRETDFSARVAVANFISRRRAVTDGELLAHLVRFNFKPRVP